MPVFVWNGLYPLVFFRVVVASLTTPYVCTLATPMCVVLQAMISIQILRNFVEFKCFDACDCLSSVARLWGACK